MEGGVRMHARGPFWRLVVPWLAMTLTAAQAAGQTPTDGPAPAPTRSKVVNTIPSDWSSLSSMQKQALQPLGGTWNTLTEPQKRKWLALSRNFSTMSDAEQATLHSRMTEWAALSAKQRTEARLNFAETRRLPAQEKKAKWEEYQALSPEEKRKLAARTPKHTGAAFAVKPSPAQKLIQIVPPKAEQQPEVPGTAVVPQRLQPNTLLPRPPASNDAAPPHNP